jgi:hypothetical protein
MSEPIVLISHLRVKDGKLEAFRESSRESFKMLEATKPGTVVHIGYVNEDRTQVSFIHVFPNAKSLDLHMEGVEDRTNKAYEFLETTGYEIYGTPSEGVMEMMKQFAGSGIPLIVEPEYMGGYMRLRTG